MSGPGRSVHPVKGSFRVGRIAGVPVTFHWSLLIIALLLSSSLAIEIRAAGWSPAIAWSTALVAAVLFFASVLAHEVGHMVVARRFGIGSDAINLWFLGGTTRLSSEPRTPVSSIAISIAGPMTNLVLGVLLGLGHLALRSNDASIVVTDTTLWLCIANLGIGVLNLLPASPLDGGRVLHGVLWRIRGDRDRTGITTARIGTVVGGAVIALGVFQLSTDQRGIWLAAVGVMLIMASRAEESLYRMRARLADVTVGDVASSGWIRLPHWSPVSAVFANSRTLNGGDIVIVEDDERCPSGFVTMAQLAQLDPSERQWLRLGELQVPLGTAPTARREELIGAVLERMSRVVPFLAVWDGNRLTGVVTQRELTIAAHRQR
jgi:Zn-dependent protease